MRAYLLATGTAFILLVVVHVWRIVVEGPHLLRNPMVVVTTLLAVAMAGWAFRLLRRLPT